MGPVNVKEWPLAGSFIGIVAPKSLISVNQAVIIWTSSMIFVISPANNFPFLLSLSSSSFISFCFDSNNLESLFKTIA